MLDIIRLVRYYNEAVTERYRSGHNEAVLKTVCPQGRVGSNPTLSAGVIKVELGIRNPQQKYPSGLRGSPGKGVGRVTGARVRIPLSAVIL